MHKKLIFRIGSCVITTALSLSAIATSPASANAAPLATDIGRAEGSTTAGEDYKLPYSPGEGPVKVTRSYAQHGGKIDFAVAKGRPIVAARSGVVESFQDGYSRCGMDTALLNQGNVVTIKHSDNTYADYVHIGKGSAKALIHGQWTPLQRNMWIEQGTPIATADCVGYSEGVHLHFQVREVSPAGTKFLQVKFTDLGNTDGGIPMTGKSYTSQNVLSAQAAVVPPPPPPPPPPPQPPSNVLVSLTVLYGGKCIDLDSGRTGSNGVQLQQYDCSGAANQKWYLKYFPDGTFSLISAVNWSKCVDIDGWSRVRNARVQSWDCHSGNNQRFRWGSSISSGGRTFSQIKNVNSGLCLDVQGYTTSNAAKLVQYDCKSIYAPNKGNQFFSERRY